jgi:hypothetical protein
MADQYDVELEEASSKRFDDGSSRQSKSNKLKYIIGGGILLLFVGAVIAVIVFYLTLRENEEEEKRRGSKCPSGKCGGGGGGGGTNPAVEQAIKDAKNMAVNIVSELPAGDLFSGKTAIASATPDRPVWQLPYNLAEKLLKPNYGSSKIEGFGLRMPQEVHEKYSSAHTSFIIMVYSSQCGWCQHFAPGYLSAARTLLGYQQNKRYKLHLMVLSEQNTPPSYNQAIDGFPTFICYNSQSGEVNLLKPSSEKPEDLKNDILAFYKKTCLQGITAIENNDNMPGLLPALVAQAQQQHDDQLLMTLDNDKTEDIKTPSVKYNKRKIQAELKMLAKAMAEEQANES